MIIRKFLYTSIVILFSLSCTAKIVNGQIVDSSSGQPISYATVMVNDTLIRMKPVSASIDGRFSIEIPDAIRHVALQISAIGYETFSYSWDVNDSIIRMQPKSYSLDGVTVSAQRKTIKNIENGIEVKIKNSPFSEFPKPPVFVMGHPNQVSAQSLTKSHSSCCSSSIFKMTVFS